MQECWRWTMVWLYNAVNIPNAPELNTYKWLKWLPNGAWSTQAQAILQSCKLKCWYHKHAKWTVCKKNNSTNLMSDGWHTRYWRKHSRWSGYWGAKNKGPSTHFQTVGAVYKFQGYHNNQFSKRNYFELMAMKLLIKYSSGVVSWRWSTTAEWGTALVIQWIRFHTPDAEDLGSIPGQGTKPVRCNHWALTS